MVEIKKLEFDHIHEAARGQFHQEVMDILPKNGVDRFLSSRLLQNTVRILPTMPSSTVSLQPMD